MPAQPSVAAVVVTHNRRELLIECLEALARQTHPAERVLVVDNASTDGTPERLESSGIGDRLPLELLPLERNGGGAEGFHYGVRAARESGVDWIWLMDDDCAPEPDALEQLLASPRAQDPGTAVIAPRVTTPEHELLPLNRGWIRPRLFLAPLVGLSPEHAQMEEVEVEHISLVGPLVRSAAARAVEPPRREYFIWFDDLEWMQRLRGHGRLWLIPRSEIVHKDPRPMPSTTLRSRWRDFRRGHEFGQTWKRTYGLRNTIDCGRRHGFVRAHHALSYVALAAVRTLLFEPHRLRALRITALYALDGWRGRFRNVPPGSWPALAEVRDARAAIAREALRYDRDVTGPVRAVGSALGTEASRA